MVLGSITFAPCSACEQRRQTMLDDFKQWAQHPFSADMNALHWFLFVGLLIVIGAAWGFVLRALKPL